MQVRFSTMSWVLPVAQAAGLDIPRKFKDADIDPALLSDKEAMVSLDAAMCLRESILSASQNTAFALNAGERLPYGAFGLIDYICASSKDVAAAMRNLCRYYDLISLPSNKLGFSVVDGMGYLKLSQDGLIGFEQQGTEFIFAVTVTRIQRATGRAIAPHSLSFRFSKPKHFEEYQRIFNAPMAFNQPADEICLDEKQLALLPVQDDPGLHQLLRGYAEKSLASIPRKNDLVEQVLSRLQDAFRSGEPSMSMIAEDLGVSERTLSRHLKAEQTSFATLRDILRTELAQNYLQDPSITITDISFLLGFSQPSAFHRAFKRWTGLAPLKYRERNLRP
jgi:AraC-like DNA-binding protein